MAIKEGWTGRVFEDFEVGDIYRHPLGRTVLATDNIWFTLLTQNTNPIHFDRAYAAKTEFKKPLVDSTFTLALVTGQSVADISQNAMANLGWDEVRLPNPALRGRHGVFAKRSARKTRIEIEAECGHRAIQDHRLYAGRNRGDRIQAHDYDLQTRAGSGNSERTEYRTEARTEVAA